MAEGVGFEPTELSLNGFQDRRLKPLGHPSLKGRFAFNIMHMGGQSILRDIQAMRVIMELTSTPIGDYLAGKIIALKHRVFKEIRNEAKVCHHQG